MNVCNIATIKGLTNEQVCCRAAGNHDIQCKKTISMWKCYCERALPRLWGGCRCGASSDELFSGSSRHRTLAGKQCVCVCVCRDHRRPVRLPVRHCRAHPKSCSSVRSTGTQTPLRDWLAHSSESNEQIKATNALGGRTVMERTSERKWANLQQESRAHTYTLDAFRLCSLISFLRADVENSACTHTHTHELALIRSENSQVSPPSTRTTTTASKTPPTTTTTITKSTLRPLVPRRHCSST